MKKNKLLSLADYFEQLAYKNLPAVDDPELDAILHYFNHKFKPDSSSYSRAKEFGITIPEYPATKENIKEVLRFLNNYLNLTSL